MPLKDLASPDQPSEVSLPASPPAPSKEVCKLINSTSMQISIQQIFHPTKNIYVKFLTSRT